MTPLYVHYQATRGVEPYLLSLEAEVGTNHFSCLVRPSVTVSVPTGMAEQDIIRFGLSPRMVIPWLAQMARTTKTVVLYDRDHFLQVMDCEIKRMGKAAWARPGIEFVDLKSRVAPLCRLETSDGQPRAPSLEEATTILAGLPMATLEGIKALHAHEDVQQLCEVA
nr:hypothetical protein [uncultured Cohaesibacter sp.]